ncbi:MAG TPA: hypothetical protein VK968_08820 [Roseimicrobium sp.]|nr:hypothetical protein [Roseimicrobium sp.]
MSASYHHLQPAHTIRRGMIGVAVFVAVIALLVGQPAVLLVVPFLIVCAWFFRALQIEITEGRLKWNFGPGGFNKSVAMTNIASASAVKTTWIEGWGIHYTRHGWLYNVSGSDAVMVELKDGGRFALGTDEPEALIAAIHQARG